VTVPAARSSPETDPVPLHDRYESRRLLGTGGMSRVLLAYDRVRREEVALKLLRKGFAQKWLTAEFRYIASLNHPGIVKVHDFGVTALGRPFFTMELVDGPDLYDFSETADMVTTINVLRSALDTLQFVHARGVVHCDIKPSNILVARLPSGTHVAKLLDFGVAWDPESAADNTGGTAVYMAPEAIENHERTPQSDLYAVGVVLFEMLTGQVPYPDDDWVAVLRAQLTQPTPDPRDVFPDIPGPLAEITVRLMEKEPADRFVSAQAVSDALGAWVTAVTPRTRRRVATVPALAARNRFIAGEPRLIGREAQVDILARAAESLGRDEAKGIGPFVLLGKPGSGTTSVAAEARIRAQLGGVAWMAVDLSNTAGPGGPLSDIAAAVAGFSNQPELTWLVDQAIADNAVSDQFLQPETPLAERLITAAEDLADAIALASQNRPFGIVLDGVDGVMPDTVPALRTLAHRVQDSPVMLVATGDGRPGGAAQTIAELDGAEVIEVRPLTQEQTDRLVVSLLGEVSEAAVSEHIYRESGGNPGAAVGVVRALVASEALVERAGGWHIAEHLGGRLPSLSQEAGLQKVAAAAVRALSSPQRQVATAASLLGEPFDRQLLRLVVTTTQPDLDTGALDRTIRELTDARVLDRSAAGAGQGARAGGYRFVHHAVRETLQQRVGDEASAQVSATVAQALDERREAGEPVDLRLYTDHLQRAGRAEDAILVGTQATEELIRAGSLDEAADILRSVITLLEERQGANALWAELVSQLGDVERRRGNFEAAIEWYEAVGVGLGGETELEAQRKLGDLLIERGEVAEGQELVQVALDAAQQQGEMSIVGRAAYTLGFHAIVSGGYDEGEGFVERALDAAEASGDVLLEARILKLRSLLGWYRGALAESERDARASARISIDMDVPRGAAEALGLLGGVCTRGGRLAEARSSYEEALVFARRAQWLSGIGKLHNSLAVVAYYEDQWDTACEHYRSGLAIADRTGNRVERSLLLNNLGLVSANRGEDEDALELYSEALAVARDSGLRKEESRVLGNLGELHIARGELQQGKRTLLESVTIAEELGASDLAIESRRRLLEHDLSAEIDPLFIVEETQTLLEQALDAGIASEAAHLNRVRGEALALAGERAPAEAALSEAHSGFKALGYGYEAARVARTAATLATYGLLDFDGVAAGIADARKLFRRLRAHPELELARHISETAGLDEEQAHLDEVAAMAAEGGPPSAFPADDAVFNAPSTRLLGLMRELSSIRNVDRLLERIVDESLALAGASRGFIVLLDPAGRPQIRVTRQVYKGKATACGASQDDLSKTVVAHVMETREPVFYDATADVAPSESAVMLGRSIGCLPLSASGRMVGVLYLDMSSSLLGPHSAEVQMVEVLAAQAAVLLENARLYEEQQRKSELLATAADELRHPLEAIMGYSELLLTSARGLGADEQQQARVVFEQARRLDVMLANLLDMGAIEARVLDWSMVSVQVKDLVSSTVEAVRPLASMREVTIDVEVPRGLPTLFGNRARLIQALTNALHRALQQSSDGDRVRVEVSAIRAGDIGGDRPLLKREILQQRAGDTFTVSEDQLVRIDVVDEGPTMPASERARLFDAFQPMASGRDDAGKPQDLGLAIARRIVERHGGRIWATPATKDTGEPGTRISTLLFALNR